MGTTVSRTSNEKIWNGGNKPLNASYGKMMMWFFIVSDALTFSGFIVLMDLLDLNMQIHGQSPMKFLHSTIYAWSRAPNDICCFYDICFDYVICNNGACR